MRQYLVEPTLQQQALSPEPIIADQPIASTSGHVHDEILIDTEDPNYEAPPDESTDAPAPIDEDNPAAEATDVNIKYSLHPDNPKNFLKLSTALTILTKTSITHEELEVADNLLREYCIELTTVSTHFHHLQLLTMSCSSMDLPQSSQITTMQLTSLLVSKTLGQFKASGPSCSNDSIVCSSHSKPIITQMENSRRHSFKSSSEHVNLHAL